MTDTLPRRNLGIESEPWGRAIQQLVAAHESDIAAVKAGLDSQNRTFGSSLENLAQQIQALPVVASATSTASPTSANSASFVTKASASIVVPPLKTAANLILLGNVALLDTVTGGIAAPPSARFLVGSQTLPLANGIPAAKDSGASNVNNVISLSSALSLDNLTPGSTITVELQVIVYHSTAYATASTSNFATLSISGTFYR